MQSWEELQRVGACKWIDCPLAAVKCVVKVLHMRDNIKCNERSIFFVLDQPRNLLIKTLVIPALIFITLRLSICLFKITDRLPDLLQKLCQFASVNLSHLLEIFSVDARIVKFETLPLTEFHLRIK